MTSGACQNSCATLSGFEFAEPGDRPERTGLVAWRADALLSAEPTHGVYTPHVFLGDDGHGHALYLHTGRADRLVDA